MTLEARIGLLHGSRDSSGVLAAMDGKVLARVSVPNAGTVGDGIDSLVAIVTRLRRKAVRLEARVTGVGLGFPGVINPVDGSVRATRSALREWQGVNLADELALRIGAPATVRNDVVAALLGEAAVGAAVGEQDVVLAYSSSGVGGAIMLGGQVLLGQRGAAGHLGHVPSEAAAGLRCTCGGTGHLDSAASADGMTRWYRNQRHLDPSDVPYLRVVADAAANGDRVAVQALELGGTALGRALGGITNLLEPEVVILAGQSCDNEVYYGAVAQALAAELIPGNVTPQLRRATLGGDAQAVGAALSA